MAQVINPQVQKDDSINTVVGGLQIYSGITDFAKKRAEGKAKDDQDAMKRKLDELNGGSDPSQSPYGASTAWS